MDFLRKFELVKIVILFLPFQFALIAPLFYLMDLDGSLFFSDFIEKELWKPFIAVPFAITLSFAFVVDLLIIFDLLEKREKKDNHNDTDTSCLM